MTSVLRRTSSRLLVGGLAAAPVSAQAAPAVASVVLVVRGQGAFDTPFESTRTAAGVDGLFVTVPAEIARTLPTLERGRQGAPELLAVRSSAVASVFAHPTGDEVLPIGGFTGTGPSPTLQQQRADVAAGEFHLVLAFPSADPRIRWVARSCRALTGATPPFQDFFCVPADAARP